MTLASLPALTSPYDVADADVASYRSNGHVLLRGLASPDEAAAHLRVLADAVARATDGVAPLADRDTYGKAFLQVCNLWQQDPGAAAFTLASRFAGVAARLLGTERVRLYHDQALFKEAGGGYTPWHQDAMYWPLDGSRCLTMWMPLVDITPQDGGLCFASGSHHDGPLSDIAISDASEEYFDDLLARRELPLAEPVPMAAGDATFHSGWTVHRALGNDGPRMRAVMTVIWYADGLDVAQPANPMQEADLAGWLPGLAPGDRAATHLNPALPADPG